LPSSIVSVQHIVSVLKFQVHLYHHYLISVCFQISLLTMFDDNVIIDISM